MRVTVTYLPIFNALPRKARAASRRGLNEWAEQVRDDARDNARLDTGEMRNSIQVEPDGDLSVSIVAGGAAAPHAIYQEFGTSTISPNLFLTGAANSNQGTLGPMLADAFRAELGG